MLDPLLANALARLDGWLRTVCDLEAARAERLGGRAQGWKGVRRLVEASSADLIFTEQPAPALIPPGAHPLGRLGPVFGLHPVEAELVLLLLAPLIEPRYRSIYAALQADRAELHPTERLALTVLGRHAERRRILQRSLQPGGRLRTAGLIRTVSDGAPPPLGLRLAVTSACRQVLLGLGAPERLEGQPVRALDALGGAPPRRVVVHGPGATPEITEAMGPRWVLAPTGPEAELAACALTRSAALAEARPVVDLRGLPTSAVDAVSAAIFEYAEAFDLPLTALSRAPLAVAAPHRHVAPTSFARRRSIWAAASDALDDAALDRLAGSLRLDRDGVARVLAAAEAHDEATLQRTARRLNATHIPHAQRIEPTRTFADLIVRPSTREALERLIYFIHNRDRVADAQRLQRRFRLDRGPVALFAGRSGTGKTLAAEVIAGVLGRPLYVVDLARLVSKYIGETEKHIDAVLEKGQAAGAVLFFDEADALFSTRVEVDTSNDRFANMEVGYLLQRIEQHDGPVILATNLRQSIDEAFLRRFHSRIEFPLPEVEERRRIWDLMIPAEVPRAAQLDLGALAAGHRISGGEIRNAALKAIFLAERRGEALSAEHLREAIRIELLELGRLSRRGDAPDRGTVIRTVLDSIANAIGERMRAVFLKEIHLVHGSPTRKVLAGRRPAVSLAMFRLGAPRGGERLRLGFIVSAWSTRPEEEPEMLGVLHDTLVQFSKETGTSHVRTHVQESVDFDLLHRFWSSHGHPVRPSLVIDIEVQAPGGGR